MAGTAGWPCGDRVINSQARDKIPRKERRREREKGGESGTLTYSLRRPHFPRHRVADRTETTVKSLPFRRLRRAATLGTSEILACTSTDHTQLIPARYKPRLLRASRPYFFLSTSARGVARAACYLESLFGGAQYVVPARELVAIRPVIWGQREALSRI